jgi:hypothetical protein
VFSLMRIHIYAPARSILPDPAPRRLFSYTLQEKRAIFQLNEISMTEKNFSQQNLFQMEFS